MKFVNAGKDGLPRFGFAGRHTDDFKSGITLDDIRWLLRTLGRITDQQLHAALLASGASEDDAKCFAQELRVRIARLKAVTAAERQ